jgi:hypothetical protein
VIGQNETQQRNFIFLTGFTQVTMIKDLNSARCSMAYNRFFNIKQQAFGVKHF